MKILVVAGPLAGRGGMETCLRTLAHQATAHGDDLRILALSPSSISGDWHRDLPYSEVPGSGSTGQQWTRGLAATVRTVRAFRPDVVVALFCSTIPLIRAAQVLALSRAPLVTWLHFSFAIRQRTELLRLADRHLCINAEIAGQVASFRGIDPDDVALVYNGTDTDVSTISRPTSGPLRIVYVGRMLIGGQKRTDDLLRAVSALASDARLDMVGDGPDLGRLRALADELGLGSRVTWWGWQAEPWSVVSQAHVLVMTSEFEGFGMVLVEAMARGVTCISTDCRSGPAEIITDGTNGWLYPVGDVDRLVERLASIASGETRLPEQGVLRRSVARFGEAETYGRIRAALEAASS